MERQRIRQSNIELLRIIAMLLVVVYHVFYYVLVDYETQIPIIKPLYTLTHVGVVIFVLISGYFGIKPSFKGVVKLYLSIVFYNLLLFFPWYFVGKNEFSLAILVKIFLPFSHSLPWLWFMRMYLFLYLLSPILNKVRDMDRFYELPQNGLKSKMGGGIYALIRLAIVLFWFGWLNRNSDLYDGRNIIEFSFLYLLGGFLKKRFVINEENRVLLRRRFGILLMISALSVGICLYFAEGRFLQILKHIFHPYSSPVLIALSSLILLYFSTLKIQSSVINWISSSTLAVYLIHENRFFEFIPWYRFIEDKFLNCQGYVSFLIISFAVLLLFSTSILIDKVRIEIMKPVDILIKKVGVKIEI